MHSYCQMCGKPLTDPKSRKMGYGPECTNTYSEQTAVIGIAKTAQAAGNLYDPDIPETSRLMVALRVIARLDAVVTLHGPHEIVPRGTAHALKDARRDAAMYTWILIHRGVLPHPPQDAAQAGALAPVSHGHGITPIASLAA